MSAIQYRVGRPEDEAKVIKGKWPIFRKDADLEALEALIGKEHENGLPVQIIAYEQLTWSSLDGPHVKSEPFSMWYPVNRA